MTDIADFFKDEATFQHYQSILFLKLTRFLSPSSNRKCFAHHEKKPTWKYYKKNWNLSFEENKENLNVTNCTKKYFLK